MAEFRNHQRSAAKLFAFGGRVSTEDQQDPASSRNWQLARSRALIEPHGGEIVAEYFDIGLSRSLPWQRRPEASRLLADLRRPDRGFDAVVIGEPARAFYGNQFGLTFPVFVHFGVELWVPEVGGPIDPGSDAHDLVMSLYGGMSKGERNRIKIRVRTAMAAQATDGRFLGGRPPYGYRLGDAGPHPNPAKAADGKRLHILEPDPATAPIVQRIYTEYLTGKGLYAIAEGLTSDGVPSPSAADPARNRHRSGIAWSKSAIRVILRNPRYTGRQVWNRQRRDETLIDVDDVALGHESKLRWNNDADWIWSTELAHEAIVDVETFTRAQQIGSAGGSRPVRRTNRRRNPYLLRGLMTCAACGRRMQGSWNNGRAHYRCKYPAEYALANTIDHAPTLYVREDIVIAAIDKWLGQLFDPDNLDATVAELLAAHDPVDTDLARLAAGRRHLADSNDKIERLVAAIESGSPADLLGPRLKELQATRLDAEREITAAQPRTPLDETSVRTILEEVGSLSAALANANPADKAKLYANLGLELCFDAQRRLVKVEAAPMYSRLCRRGDLYLNPTRFASLGVLSGRVRLGKPLLCPEATPVHAHPELGLAATRSSLSGPQRSCLVCTLSGHTNPLW